MNIPYNEDAEEAVIGCCLFNSEPARWVAEWLSPTDFYVPKWRNAAQAILSLHAHGQKSDSVTVAAECARLGLPIAPADLIGALANSPAPSSVQRYGHLVRRASVARSLLSICNETVSAIQKGEIDSDELMDGLMADLRSVDSHVPIGKPDGFMTFEELRAKPHEMRSPWVVKTLLRKDWRAVIVGPEGSGKSIILRQLAVTAAMGISPFGQPGQFNPCRVLLVDLENPEDHLTDWVGRLCSHGEQFKKQTEGRGAVWHRPGGIDLRKRAWRSQFEQILREHQPDLVCLGPLYKAFRRKSSETEEEAAGELQEVLDDLRTRHGFALAIEHHAPKGQNGVRSMQPFGSSLWLRWGEIRMGLVPPSAEFPVMSMELRPFSGSRVEHSWPTRIDRSKSGLPWIGYWPDGMGEF